MTNRDLPTTLAGARTQYRATKGVQMVDDEGEGPPPEMLKLFDETMDIGFVAGVAWLLALINTARHDKERRDELPLILEGVQLDLKREAFTMEKRVRKEVGDEKVDAALKEAKKVFRLHGTDDEQQAPSLRDIEETRAALKKAAETPPKDAPQATRPDERDSDGPSDNGGGKDHSNGSDK